ncbi:MAG TPA: O-antigen ligase family protein [Verrucomicrobiae bacterium]|nr:O-antigen ligase family protein [Verrucomicrobiae bacterium]
MFGLDRKDTIGFILLFCGSFGGTLIACLSQRVRDLFFFLIVSLTIVTEHVAMNFVSKEWYRGTSRGFEVSLIDILAISLVASAFVRPRLRRISAAAVASGDDRPENRQVRAAGIFEVAPGVYQEKRWFWPASFGLMILLFLYACVCVAMADPKIFGLFALSKMVRGIIVFLAAAFYVRSERELKLFVFALGATVCFEGLYALGERYINGTYRVPGTVDDSNSLSMYLCTTAPVFMAVLTSRFPIYIKALGVTAIAVAFVGVILTISRAGLIAILIMLFAAGIMTVSYRLTLRRIIIVLLVLCGIGGALAKSWKTVGDRFKNDSLKQEYGSKHVQNRGYYIRIALAIANDSWFGVGPNNWSYLVSNKYGPRLGWHFVPYMDLEQAPSQLVPAGRDIDEPQAAPAHSLAALTIGEMGFGGFAIFSLLWVRWLLMGASFLWPRTPDPMRRMGVGIFFGICGNFFQSCTEWVFHQSPIFFTFNIMIGVLASLCYLRKQERRARKVALEYVEEESTWHSQRPAEAY